MDQRLAQGELVLVTGANGYLAGHVVDNLLSRGFRVRGSVRKNQARLNVYFDNKYGAGMFETFLLPNLADVDRCTQALEGVSGIVHVAADTTGSTDWEDVVSSAVEGATTILRAAVIAKTVQSVVVTSTVCTSELPRHNSPQIAITPDCWNLSALDSLKNQTCADEDKPTITYAAAKTEAERACWEFVEEERPDFVVNAVLPCYIMGPMIPPQPPVSTMAFVANLLDNDSTVMQLFPPEWHVDVRDTALLHVAALLSPDCRYERLFSCAQPFRWTDVLGILKDLRPDAVLPEAPMNEQPDGISYKSVQARSAEVMNQFRDGSGWISLKDSIAAGIAGRA